MKNLESFVYGEKDNEIDFFFEDKKSIRERIKKSLKFGILGKITLGFFVIALFPVILIKRNIIK